MGALSSSSWNSILLAIFWVMKLRESPVFKRHNTSHLETLLFKKIRRLRSLWASLMVGPITLEPPLLGLGLDNLWNNVPLHCN